MIQRKRTNERREVAVDPTLSKTRSPLAAPRFLGSRLVENYTRGENDLIAFRCWPLRLQIRRALSNRLPTTNTDAKEREVLRPW